MVLDQPLFTRIFRIQGILVLLGVLGFAFAAGKIAGMSFLVGATLGTLSLWILLRAIGLGGSARPAPLAILLMTTRLLIAAVVLYVILRTYEVHLWAIATGVLTHLIAIILATLYDYFHARTP